MKKRYVVIALALVIIGGYHIYKSDTGFSRTKTSKGIYEYSNSEFSFTYNRKLYDTGKKSLFVTPYKSLSDGKYYLLYDYGGYINRMPSVDYYFDESKNIDRIPSAFKRPGLRDSRIDTTHFLYNKEWRYYGNYYKKADAGYFRKVILNKDTLELPLVGISEDYLDRYTNKYEYYVDTIGNIRRKIVVENTDRVEWGMIYMNDIQTHKNVTVELHLKNKWYGFFKPKLKKSEVLHILNSVKFID